MKGRKKFLEVLLMFGIVLMMFAFIAASAVFDADSFYRDSLYDPTIYLVRVN